MKALIPNLLTLSRLVLMPVSLYFFAEGLKELALFTYVLIALTDYWDGYFARHWNVTSSLGIILDQVSDKLVGLGFFTGLSFLGLCPFWFLGLLCGITFLLSLGYVFAQVFHLASGPQPSLRIGKWSTALQYLWIGWLFLESLMGWLSENSTLRLINFCGFMGLGILQIWVFIQYTLRLSHQKSSSEKSVFLERP